MKLIFQIPCYGEAETLVYAVADLPAHIPGVEKIETLVISDGTDDDTLRAAGGCRVDHIVNLACNKGVALAWSGGIGAAQRAGADIIVTCGDSAIWTEWLPSQSVSGGTWRGRSG